MYKPERSYIMTPRDKLILAIRLLFNGVDDISQTELTLAIIATPVLHRLWLNIYGSMSPSGLPTRIWMKLVSDIYRTNRNGQTARTPGTRVRTKGGSPKVRIDKHQAFDDWIRDAF